MTPVPHDFQPTGVPIDDDTRWWAAQLAHQIGLSRAARLIGVSESALARAAGGFSIFPATDAKIRAARMRLSS